MLFSRGCTNPNWFSQRRLTMHPPRKGSGYFSSSIVQQCIARPFTWSWIKGSNFFTEPLELQKCDTNFCSNIPTVTGYAFQSISPQNALRQFVQDNAPSDRTHCVDRRRCIFKKMRFSEHIDRSINLLLAPRQFHGWFWSLEIVPHFPFIRKRLKNHCQYCRYAFWDKTFMTNLCLW